MVSHRFTETTPVGQLAIEFVNTVAHGRTGDALASPEHLHRWLVIAGVAHDHATARFPASLPDQRRLTEEAHRLRAETRALMAAISEGTVVRPTTLLALNRILSLGHWSHGLILHNETLALRVVHAAEEPVSLLVPIAVAAAEVAAYARPERLRACVAADCTRWFLDVSKGGRRRWCSMATCGNRSKAARFRERQTVEE